MSSVESWQGTPLHESVAKALYKRNERLLREDYNQAAIKAKIESLPSKRRARLRAVPKVIDSIPGMVVLRAEMIGQGKRTELTILGAERFSEESGRSSWKGFSIHYGPRNMGTSQVELPVIITQHAVERTMQRLGITKPREALRMLAPAVICALWLRKPPRKGRRLLPATGGAVVAVRDSDYGDFWTFVTFVDQNKLDRGEQHKELLRVREEVSALLGRDLTDLGL